MALPDAHLLRLPREVRAQIFGDASLSHLVFFDWKWKCRGMHRVGFKVTVSHAPRLSILLVCSRFYEYFEDLDPNHRLLDIEWDGAIVAWRCLKVDKEHQVHTSLRLRRDSTNQDDLALEHD
jgi:hypothetical protein